MFFVLIQAKDSNVGSVEPVTDITAMEQLMLENENKTSEVEVENGISRLVKFYELLLEIDKASSAKDVN